MFLLFMCTAVVHAQEVSIRVTNASLKQVFKEIERQTPYRFSYRDGVVDGRRDITLDLKQASVTSVLDRALESRGLSYEIVSPKSIVISAKKKDDNPNFTPPGKGIREAA